MFLEHKCCQNARCNNKNTNNNTFKKEGFAAIRYFLSIFTVDECKTRWRTIRDPYKEITKKTAGSAEPVKSKHNRDNLTFLDSCLQDRR